MSKNNENKLEPNLRFPEFKNEGEWVVKKLGELVSIKSGYSPSKYNLKSSGKFPFIKVEDLNNCKKYQIESREYSNDNENIIPKQSVIFPKRGAAIELNKVRINVEAILMDTNLMAITPNDNVNTEFLYYEILKDGLYKIADTSTIPQINNKHIEPYEVALPTKSEQQKIASCLSSLDEVIKAESQKLGLLENHKRGLLQNLLPVGKETTPKFRFKEFENSDEWVKDTLIKLGNFRRGSFPQPYGLPEWYDDENGMPFIQVFDVGEDFRLKPTTKRKISELAAQQSVFIPKGTLIITIQGSIGRVAITQYDAYIDRTLLLFEKFHQEIDITFFAYTLFLLFEIEKQKAPGGIIKTITKEVLSSFVVKLPTIDEQRKIASCLSSLDELISAQSEKIEALRQHEKGLLQGLFPNIKEVTE